MTDLGSETNARFRTWASFKLAYRLGPDASRWRRRSLTLPIRYRWFPTKASEAKICDLSAFYFKHDNLYLFSSKIKSRSEYTFIQTSKYPPRLILLGLFSLFEPRRHNLSWYSRKIKIWGNFEGCDNFELESEQK